MSQDHNEASSSSSSRPATSKPVAEGIEFLLNEAKQLREEVHSCKTLQTLIFFSRVINTAFEALNTMVDTFNAMNQSSEAEHIANCCKEACDVNKQVRVMLSNVVQTPPSTSNAAGGYKKVPMWKKQCGKNIDKIELLIKEAFAREFLTWFDAFAFHGMFHGFSGVLACLYNFLAAFDDDQSLKTYAEMILETFENTYRDIVCKENAKLIQGIKHKEQQLLAESNLKCSPKEGGGEQEVLEKSQEDDIMKGFQEQCSVSQKNRQEEEMGQEIIQDKEEVQKNSQEAEINKKLQEAETQEKSQGDEALKKIQEEEAPQKLEEEEALSELHLVEETQEKLQKDEEMKNQTKEEALKDSQEEDTQNKLHEEEEALKKIQEEETEKNSQETGADKKLQEEEAALMESQMEENAGEKIVKFGYLTFKMKNGVLERVLD